MKRGEVWWAQLPSPVGRRPVVLLSRDTAYRVRSARDRRSCYPHDQEHPGRGHLGSKRWAAHSLRGQCRQHHHYPQILADTADCRALGRAYTANRRSHPLCLEPSIN